LAVRGLIDPVVFEAVEVEAEPPRVRRRQDDVAGSGVDQEAQPHPLDQRFDAEVPVAARAEGDGVRALRDALLGQQLADDAAAEVDKRVPVAVSDDEQKADPDPDGGMAQGRARPRPVVKDRAADEERQPKQQGEQARPVEVGIEGPGEPADQIEHEHRQRQPGDEHPDPAALLHGGSPHLPGPKL